MSLPRSTTQLVSPNAYISSIELGKLPPPPDANFAVLIYPICVVGAAICGAAVALCTTSTGAKIACPAPSLGWGRSAEEIAIDVKAYLEWMADTAACIALEAAGEFTKPDGSLDQNGIYKCFERAKAEFYRKTGKHIWEFVWDGPPLQAPAY